MDIDRKEKGKPFPVGIQDFKRIQQDDYLYIDKTEIIYQMIKNNVGVFLSRPRRFGKSLLVSTLKAIFLGNKELFNGLWIATSDYEWKKYHLIDMDFSRLVSSSTVALSSSLQSMLEGIAKSFGLDNVMADYPSVSLINIVKKLSETEKVVILIDEYDKPLVHHFGNVDLLSSNRNLLRDFFMAIKSLSSHIQFTFVTGVSKFTKVSLFSGMNNLEDISLEAEYSSLVGLTEPEITRDFKIQLHDTATMRKEDLAATLNAMKTWYNGYRFFKEGKGSLVYNPLSVMQFLRKHRLDNFWFSTATPTFAIELIKKREFPVTRFEEGPIAGMEIEESHEVDDIDLTTLLYQTGYLTIREYDEKSQFYRLGFPNEEVRRSFLEHLLHGFSEIESSDINSGIFSISKAIKDGDLDSFVKSFNALLSGTPYQLHIKKEAYYHSLIYLVLRALGYKVDAEICTSKGRIDMVLETSKNIYIFEFKIDKSAKEGFDQILEQGYHERFLNDKRGIILVSMNFSSESRTINDWRKIDYKEI